MKRNTVTVLTASCLVLPLILSGYLTYHLNTAKAFLFLLLVVAAAATALVSGIGAGRGPTTGRGARMPSILLVYLAYIASHLVSAILVAVGRPLAYLDLSGVQIHIASWLLLYLFWESGAGTGDLRVLVRAFALSVTVVAGLGVAEAIGLVSPFGMTSVSEGHIVATAGNASYLAGLLVFALPATVAAGASGMHASAGGVDPRGPVSPRRWAGVVGWIAAVALQSVALLLTLNRAAWAILLVVAFLFVVLRWPFRPSTARSRRSVTVAALIGVLVVAAAVYAISPAVQQRVTRTVADGWAGLTDAVSVRLQLWQAATGIIHSGGPAQWIFGHAPGSFYRLMFSTYPADYRLYTLERGARFAHNEVLDHLVEGGALSAALLVTLVLVVAAAIWRRYRSSRSGADASRWMGILAAGTALVFHSMLHITGRTMIGQVCVVLLLAAGVVADRDEWLLAGRRRPIARNPMTAGRRLTARSRQLSAGRPRPVLPDVVVLCCAIVLPALQLGSAASEYLLLRAVDSRDTPENALPVDVRRIDQALAWYPRNVYALYQRLWWQKEDATADVPATADRITELIPHYRSTDRIVGIYLTQAGNYEAAYRALVAYLETDSIEPGTYLHAISVLTMMDRRAEAIDRFRQFLASQYRYFAARPGQHVDLPDEMPELPSDSMLAETVRVLAEQSYLGYDWVKANLTLNVAVILERSGLGDVAADYYIQVYLARRLDQQWQRHVFDLITGVVERADELRLVAERGRQRETARALLSRQIQLLDYQILLRPAESLFAIREGLMSLYNQTYR